MRPRLIQSIVAATLLLLAGWSPAAGQERPKIGLALSGGGVRGFAQIGVLQVLEEENIPVDIVTGTSIGSVIGGLYAIGYTAEDLREIALNQDWDQLLAVGAPRRRRPVIRRVLDDVNIVRLAIRDRRPALPSSLVTGQRIAMVLSRLTLPYHGTTDFSELPRSFAAVATNLETGKAVRLTEGNLAEAIRASISLPSAFAPVKIDGLTLIDGGIARNLPAEDARALGADYVVCVDATRDLQPPDSLESMLDVMNQAVSFQIRDNLIEQRKYCDLYLRPRLNNHDSFDFASSEEILKLGYEQADSLRAMLRELIRSTPGSTARTPVKPEDLVEDQYTITSIDVRGVGERLQRHIVVVMNLPIPGPVAPGQIELAVDRLYSSGPFSQVIYRLLPDAGGHRLVLDVTEKYEGQIGASLRFDSRYKASILLSAAGLRRVGYGPTVRGAVRLGQITTANINYVIPISYRRPLSLRLTGGGTRYPIDTFADGAREAEFLATTAEAVASLGIVLARRWALAAGMRFELYDLDRRVAGANFLLPGNSAIGPEAMLLTDTFDRDVFARRGHRLDMHAMKIADPAEGSSFSRLFVDWEARWMLSETVSLLGRASMGAAGGDVPLHYLFYLGGASEQPALERRLVPLFGASTYALSGTNMQAFAAGIQVQVMDDWFIAGRWNMGWAGNDWQWRPDDMHPGFGISVGRQLLFVPAVLTLGSRGPAGPYELWINLGYEF